MFSHSRCCLGHCEKVFEEEVLERYSDVGRGTNGQ